MLERQLGDLARADDQHTAGGADRPALPGDIQRDRHGREVAARDLGAGAHQLTGRQRAVQQPVHALPGHAGRLRIGQRRLDLHHHLILAQHHRVQPSRQAKQVPDSIGAAERVQVRRQMLQRDADANRPESASAPARPSSPDRDQAADLDTIACRDDEPFVDILAQRQQRLAHGLRAKGQPLAHHDRAGSLVGSDNDKLHVGLPSYKSQVTGSRQR